MQERHHPSDKERKGYCDLFVSHQPITTRCFCEKFPKFSRSALRRWLKIYNYYDEDGKIKSIEQIQSEDKDNELVFVPRQEYLKMKEIIFKYNTIESIIENSLL